MNTRTPRFESAPIPAAAPPEHLQRKCACGGTPGLDGECAACRAQRLREQRAENQAETSAAPPIVQDVLRSPGEPIETETRALMEAQFGHDFSRVRVHADAEASEAARAVNAKAYTVGEDIVFRDGAYDPAGPGGRRLLAHELAHVVQQAGAAEPSKELSAPSDPSERAAERAAHRVVSDGRTAGSLGVAEAHVSREPQEEEWTPPDPTGGWTPPTTNVLQEFDADTGKGRKPWDLDKLVKQIAEVLAISRERYIEVVGYYESSEGGPGAGAGAAREAALKRANLVRRALLEWAPKFKGRVRVATRDRELLRESGGEPTRRQIAVEWGPFVIPGLEMVPGLGASWVTEPLLPAPPGAEEEPGRDIAKDLEEFFVGEGLEVKVRGEHILRLSMKGVTRTLHEAEGTKADITLGLTGSLKLKVSRRNWNFAANVSPVSGAWELRLSFPRESWLPDVTRLKAIMDRGREAALAVGEAATDPATYRALERAQEFDDFTALFDRFSPYVDPIAYAIEAAQGFAEHEGGPSFGIAVGSGQGPGGPTPTPEEAAEGPKGIYARGVLTLRF